MRAGFGFAAGLGAAAVALLVGSAWPQTVTVTPDLSGIMAAAQAAQAKADAATTAAAQAIAAAAAAQAAIPQPASIAPPSETVAGAAGTAATYRRGDAVQPRITRSATITLDASGAGTFDWTSQGALAAPVQPVITPIYAGASAPTCAATAVTATSVSVKCLFGNPLFLTLGQLTTAGVNGMSLNPFASPAAGISVAIVALPKS